MTTDKKAWGEAAITSHTDITTKSWHHIADTYDAKLGQAKVYLDGKLDGKGKLGGTITANNDVLWLGRVQNHFWMAEWMRFASPMLLVQRMRSES